jgi:hypothetical protein
LSFVAPSRHHRPFGANDFDGGGGAREASPEFWYYIAISSFLVLAGGVFAGYARPFREEWQGGRKFMDLFSFP